MVIFVDVNYFLYFHIRLVTTLQGQILENPISNKLEKEKFRNMSWNKDPKSYNDSSYPNTDRNYRDSADSTDERNLEKLSEACEIYKSEIYQALTADDEEDLK